MTFECVRIFPRWWPDAFLSSPDGAGDGTGGRSSSDDDDDSDDCDEQDDIHRVVERPAAEATTTTKVAPTTRILLDIVGGRGLGQGSNNKVKASVTATTTSLVTRRRVVDPYCVVRVAGRLVHKTKTVRDDPDPIWTIESSSLCVLEIRNPPKDDKGNEDDESVTIEVRSGSELLFDPVRLSAAEMIECTSKEEEGVHRREVVLRPKDSLEKTTDAETTMTVNGNASLSIQFRLATTRDVQVLDRVYRKAASPVERDSSPVIACDWTFARESALDLSLVRQRSLRKRPRPANNDTNGHPEHELVHRVQPGPDPKRRGETEWLTDEEIQREYLKPSTLWHSSVTSDRPMHLSTTSHGTIHLEILGCDHLPRLDLTGKSDPFCAILYENHVLRTDVLWNCQSPRWMPWTTRAFELPIRHPYSLLFVAAFDYDSSPIVDSSFVSSHDPIGRIVLHPSRFEPNVTHVLSFRLDLDDGHVQNDEVAVAGGAIHESPTKKDATTIKIRLRVHWRGDSTVPPVALVATPRCVLHVKSDRSFQVLRYLARGSVDMDQASVASVRAYGEELVSYVWDYCYLLDVMFEVFLWRGRARFLGRSIWFPIQSIVWFGALCLCLEFPKKTPAILLYGICWILMSTQYHSSRQPNPWRRVKALDQRLRSILLCKFQSNPTVISPNAGVAEERRLRRLDAVKGQRMGRLIYQTLMFCLSVYRIYSKTSPPVFVTEAKDWSLLSGRLYYLHMFLQYLCTYIRSFRNFIHWRAGSSTQRFTGYCLLFGTAWMVLPVDRAAHWAIRAWIWTLFGPWMKLVDVMWVKRWYRTREQLLDAIDAGAAVKDEEIASQDVPDFDAWLRSDVFVRMGHRGRQVAEEACKQQAWRRTLLGTYSERVPSVDSSRYPSTPLPSSFSRAERVEAAEETIVYIPPQELVGTMVPALAHEEE